jgi:uncharacterized protein (DUF2252 family)
MENDLLSGVKETRLILRKQQLATVFAQFDHGTMHLSKEQRLEKYKKMKESPFRFFRGSAYLFYYDTTKVTSAFHTPDNRPTWIMGDMHMDNFGAFQNENGNIVYDVNDFDEGYVGSYLFDIIRMSVSIAMYLEEQGLDEQIQQQAITSYIKQYIKQLERFQKKKDDPMTLIFTKENTKGPIKRVLKKLEKRQHTHLVEEITVFNDEGERTFAWNDEIQPISKNLFEQIVKLFPHYVVKDIAVKYGTGTASIGLERYYLLVDGQHDASGYENLVLEMKEVRTAIPAYFFPYNELFWESYAHQGARVVGTQRAMHHLEDPHLAYVTLNGKEYYIRERSPYKRKVKPKNYQSVEEYIMTTGIMGKITAKIHARADIDYSEVFTYHSEDEILRKIHKGEKLFVEKIVLQAMNYKEIVLTDYELFCEWINEYDKN